MSAALQGQCAMVTGGGSGLGAAIAQVLAKSGASVVVNYLGAGQDAEQVVRGIADAGGTAVAVEADISKPDDVERLANAAVQRFGTLDIMVANAGVQVDAPLLDMTLGQWEAALAVDLSGTFLCLQAAARVFVRQGVREGVSRAAGKVVCISSVHQVIPWAGHANYAAAKGGVQQLVRTAAQELAGQRIRVNAVAPGAIRTAINQSVWSDPVQEKALIELIPYGRLGAPEDVAAAVMWLASDAADYVTGTTLFVDGGMQLYSSFRSNG
jgi:glucose 1-dehydrogenase